MDLFHPKSGSFHAIGIELSYMLRQRLVWCVQKLGPLNLLNPVVYYAWSSFYIIFLMMLATFGVHPPWRLPLRIGTWVLRVSACTGRAVGVAWFRSGAFNPINSTVVQTIRNQPYFDGLYHPFMVILGMVYYCFTISLSWLLVSRLLCWLQLWPIY